MAATLILALLTMTLTGCGPLVTDEVETLSIYATFWPVYALTEAVTRGVPDVALRCLVQPQNGCLRTYQLSEWDAALLSSGADAVIMGGRGLESFESTLFGWGDAGPEVSAVLYNLELYNQDDSTQGDSEAESHLHGANPHLYMSISGAKEIIESISAMMQTFDPRYADQYVSNAQSAAQRLDALLAETKGELNELAGKRVIVMNEALVYPALDYDLEVAGFIERESGENLAGQALEKCLELLSGMEAKVLLIERQAPGAFVDALEANGYAVARLDVLSTRREGEGFDDYIECLRGNAQAIRDAFDRADAGRDGQ